MILVLVGRPYSDKYKVSRDLIYHSKSRFSRIKSYTTNSAKRYNTHYYMSREALAKRDESEILYRVTNDFGNDFFFLKEQFSETRDVIMVIDDPAGLAKLEELGIPYAVVFVDCAEGTALYRAEEYSDDMPSVLSRMDVIHDRLLAFDMSGEYSLYLNTTQLAPTSRTLACSVFISQVRKWLATRSPDELKMPTLKDMVGGHVLRVAKSIGYGVAFITEG